MLEYTKTILQKVSFDKDLFLKELKKSFQWLEIEEITVLKNWVVNFFSEMYGDIIKGVFQEDEVKAIPITSSHQEKTDYS